MVYNLKIRKKLRELQQLIEDKHYQLHNSPNGDLEDINAQNALILSILDDIYMELDYTFSK